MTISIRITEKKSGGGFSISEGLITNAHENQCANKTKDSDFCTVVGGTHAGKCTVRDINTSKTGHITITVEQKNGVRLKTLGKNVVIQSGK